MSKRITRELPAPATTGKTDEFISDSGIRVKCVYPENVPEHIRMPTHFIKPFRELLN